MLRHRYPIYALIALTSIASCKDEEQQADEALVTGVYDHTVDFSSYHTYDVVEPTDLPEDEVPPSSLLEVNRVAINQAIIDEMDSRGYVRDKTAPDLRINTFVRLRETEVVVQSNYWYDYYYGWYWGYQYPWYYQDVSTLEAGTLIIDAIAVGNPDDSADDLMVFRGTATELLPDSPTDVSKEIPKIVDRIFSYWPES